MTPFDVFWNFGEWLLHLSDHWSFNDTIDVYFMIFKALVVIGIVGLASKLLLKIGSVSS